VRISQDDLLSRFVISDNFLKADRAPACVQAPPLVEICAVKMLVCHAGACGDEVAARIFSSIFRGFAGGRHLYKAWVKGGADFDEVGLVGHDVIDVFVDHRDFVETGRQ
jgi:hypothetical protein